MYGFNFSKFDNPKVSMPSLKALEKGNIKPNKVKSYAKSFIKDGKKAFSPDSINIEDMIPDENEIIKKGSNIDIDKVTNIENVEDINKFIPSDIKNDVELPNVNDDLYGSLDQYLPETDEIDLKSYIPVTNL